MSKRDDLLLLKDMLEACQKIQRYTAGMKELDFLNDEKTKDAVIRNFEIIGEASNRVDSEFKDSFKLINWMQLRGFRNRIVHEYFGIDYELVWTIIQININPLTTCLEEYIGESE